MDASHYPVTPPSRTPASPLAPTSAVRGLTLIVHTSDNTTGRFTPPSDTPQSACAASSEHWCTHTERCERFPHPVYAHYKTIAISRCFAQPTHTAHSCCVVVVLFLSCRVLCCSCFFFVCVTWFPSYTSHFFLLLPGPG